MRNPASNPLGKFGKYCSRDRYHKKKERVIKEKSIAEGNKRQNVENHDCPHLEETQQRL